MCGGVLFISLYLRMQSFERLKANSIVNPELLREPKPSIRAGHIHHMQTNKLALLPPTAPVPRQRKIGCKDVRRSEGMPHEMKIRKPSCGVKVKGQANIRINEE